MIPKIEKGIPSPKRAKLDELYPFAHMEVGDSFAVPIDGRNVRNLINAIRRRAHDWRQRDSSRCLWMFTVTQDRDVFVRCWRAPDKVVNVRKFDDLVNSSHDFAHDVRVQP